MGVPDWLGVREDTGNGRRSCRVTKVERKGDLSRFGNIRSLKPSIFPTPTVVTMEALVARLSDGARPTRPPPHDYRSDKVTVYEKPHTTLRTRYWTGGLSGCPSLTVRSPRRSECDCGPGASPAARPPQPATCGAPLSPPSHASAHARMRNAACHLTVDAVDPMEARLLPRCDRRGARPTGGPASSP